MKKIKRLKATALILMFAVFFGCDGLTDSDKLSTVITWRHLTSFVGIPAEGRIVSAINIDTPEFKGTGIWKTWAGQTVTEEVFSAGEYYMAVITLTEKPGYTFDGVGLNYFTHAVGTSTNAPGTGNVTITFEAAASRAAPLWRPVPAFINKIGDLNSSVPVPDSHANDLNVRHMELNRRNLFPRPSDGANHSPRLKRMQNGRYILFYQNAQVSAQVFYTRSDDLEHWDAPRTLFAQRTNEIIYVRGNPTLDSINYTTGDAVVLQDGRVMAVATFFASSNHRNTNTADGLAIRVSEDNGETWGPEQVIFRGRNWEPHIIQLRPKPGEQYGEIHVFCTSPATSYEIQFGLGEDWQQVTSSGSVIIRSTDNGKTWLSHWPENEFYTFMVAQSWHARQNGINRYTNQMPVAVELNNGTLVLALEDIRDGTNADGFPGNRISLAYSNNNWTEFASPSSVMGAAENVPSDRGIELWQGSAPYIVQFPSGEVLVTYNTGNTNHPANSNPTGGWNALSFRLGDYRARNFDGEWNRAWQSYQPFTWQGVYGSMTLDNSHTVVHTFSSGTFSNGIGLPLGRRDIIVSRLQLNHTIYPARKTAAGEFNSEALFIGSESQAQAAIRAAYDDDYIYILTERLDRFLRPGDLVDVYLHAGGSKTLDRFSLGLTVGQDGLAGTYRYSIAEGWEPRVIGNIQARSYVIAGEGYTVEAAIPLAAIRATSGSVNITFELHNIDSSGPAIKDTLFNVNLDEPNTWLTMVFN